MPRHEHEVRVVGLPGAQIALVCRCGWSSKSEGSPTVSRLTEIARDHRRDREQP